MELDLELSKSRIQEISNADGVAAFFAELGWNTSSRIGQTPGNLGITAESTVKPIKKIELIADQENQLQVYLVELRSVTVAQTRALSRTFKNLAGEFLLVLTSDYEKIDFVLLERFLPKKETRDVATPQVSVRPRVLTLDRRDPTAVHLRVLRRFTYTESDPLYQFEKLKAAYGIADWSEDFFNNRALFSDYFLNRRLPDWEEWGDVPKSAFESLLKLYKEAPSTFGGKKEEILRSDLLEPTFKALGFDFVKGKRFTSGDHEPDYYLHSIGEKNGSIAVCLAYPWDRSLDGKDDKRDQDTPEENPGAVVVSLLEREIAPWAIITNGRVWRLYSQKTHSRATNYYEIDLEEALSRPESIKESFRYFWLFFRSQAFELETIEVDGKEKKTCFLDRLLEESESYAKELGDRLKERVFETIFPHLSEGFVKFIRERDGLHAEIDQAVLDEVFQGTLTLLYRLLFLLYAESRDLLPVRERRGYYTVSLTRMKQEVADHAGTLSDEVAKEIKKHYRDDEYTIYERLTQLFKVIDLGDSSLNVPLYNGGLFLSEPDQEDPTSEAKNGRFLNGHKVPDRFLAQAIDRLARDIDLKRQDLVFIDFKSLGVRQLGSIYEGLLEFKLRIAPEKMALVKGKKAELVVPYREAQKDSKIKILTVGRGQNSKERTLSKGTVYLENDKRERKATGSYYTPDHIVEYIVANAVGPVLEEKFEKMRPKLREAQKERKAFFDKQKALEKSGIKPEPIEKADLIGRDLVDELFDIKVLDKAMGSGHFLVETVDFITDKAIDFLNAFPWNPVFAHLERMRQTILKEMDEQTITIDPARLTDVNLLKRHILKKCIYGVDLNPMAVELAKVSLWLDCFTLGAPLSFLDHHLKCGNSLIGVNVQEVRDAVEGKAGEASQQMLFGSQFAGLMLATDLMRHVGDLSDVTSEQVKQSRAEYRKASDQLAPFKRILDVYTSQWFGNTPYKHKVGKSTTVLKPAISFLKDRESEQWIKKPHDLDSLSSHGREIASIALAASEEKRFFHWELEFPEVFYGPRPGTTQAIERLPDAGFDAVIGNPPYVRQEGLGEDKPFFEYAHAPVYSGVADLYVYFYHRGLSILRPGGRFGMITSNKFLRAKYGKALRTFLKQNKIVDLIDFRDLPIFEDAIAYPLILIAERNQPAEDHALQTHSVADMDQANRIAEVMDTAPSMSLTSLSEDGWTLKSPEVLVILEKIRKAGKPLGEVVEKKFYYGIKTGFNEAFIVDETKREELIAADPKSAEIIKPFLRGKDVKRWKVEWSGLYLIKTEMGVNIKQYPAILDHLKVYREALEARWDKGDHWWELRTCAYYLEFEKPKIVYPDIYEHQSFAYDTSGALLINTLYFIPTKERWMVGLLNSNLMEFFYREITAQVRGGYMRSFSVYIQQLPIVDPPASAKKNLDSLIESIISNPDDDGAIHNHEMAIDEIVYGLYGLTGEEIRLVEGTSA